MKKITPLGKNILVKVSEEEKTTESGIVLPETSSEERPQKGKVVEVGDSKKINEKIKKGVTVVFAKFSGSEIELEDEEYLILKSEDILAVLE
ncbi:MAG: co-chaperone GroES [Candidatus Moraniibacteriota bacterium]